MRIRVKFHGLRLLKKGGAVTRAEVLGWIKEFLGGHDFEGDLEVVFLAVPSLDHPECRAWGIYRTGRNRVEVALGFPERPRSRLELMLTIAHELDHLLWEFQKLPWDYAPAYWERKHEIRAFASAEAFAGRRWTRM
ncbi:MAG: hypothetical protein A2940_01175 [Candidatus Wildermuthbacteria bacterium RIFCSPLOWO2_01_FULL_48_29]|uniref:Uncharacterized protein n=1 Tax=Candidatus Wildermuthbacteria bacterium RIFCSPLOWO2_01_FULL_48_29 TaxID=1802462 RepID=A0A1G2RKF3_9BACT|nr:MAG: hypothetical protein A2940_01175 [Candidatus Wildermuthbacteria bacterium RIFCSPLOWO2_01_FULL_48_29]